MNKDKTLIAYFSHAGQNYFVDGLKTVKKGNAKIIAEKIQEMTNADIFEIETIRKYSNNYATCCDEAKIEQRNGEFPELKNYLPDINKYESIILVYPCWWGTMPQAAFTFLKHYDFSGKNIYPLCTHEGSGMGRSERDIKVFCPQSRVLQGLPVQGSYADKCGDALKDWLNH